MMSRRYISILFTLLIAVLGSIAPRAFAQQPSEYQVKAALLLNFAQFIDWPASAFTSDSAPIVIGVLGNDPFGSTLEDTVAGETAQGRPLVVKRSQQVEDLKDCHLLFISRSEKERIADIVQTLRDTSVVTVSDAEGLTTRGAIFSFLLRDKKVRFDVNSQTAQNKKLKISSQLLKRANHVEK